MLNQAEEKRVTFEWRHPVSGVPIQVVCRKVDLDRVHEKMRAGISTGEARVLVDFLSLHGTTVEEEVDRPTPLVTRDPVEGARRRDEALARVERAAAPDVKRDAERAVRALALEREEITSDDVWERMTLLPSEPRMLGPIMKAAERRGEIEQTDRTVLSSLPQNHRRPVRVWRSRIHGVL